MSSISRIYLASNLPLFMNAGAPTDGTAGTAAGEANIGAFLVDTTNARLYMNTGTMDAPVWTWVGRDAAAEAVPSAVESTVALGAGGSATQTVTITLKDQLGAALAGVRKVRVYLADDDAGATPASAGPATSVTATTGVVLKAHTAKLDLDVVTNASGVAVLVLNNTGGGGAYAKYAVLALEAGVVVSAVTDVATA